jgi:aminomethyltransferase
LIAFRYVVTNAGCIAGDTALLKEHLHKWTSLKKDVHIEHLHGRGLLAVQGPGARKILHNALTDSINKLYFMQSVRTKVLGIDDCRVTRCGYTGEDGVEVKPARPTQNTDYLADLQISVAAKDAPALTEKLLKATGDNVRMAGLGARDALRLEAGLCLYGHDIDATTTPIEAGLLWLIGNATAFILSHPNCSKTTTRSSRLPGRQSDYGTGKR